MHAHTPPFTKPEAAYDSRRLYNETGAIAATQDAKLDPGNDALPSILADFRAVVKRMEAYAERLRGKRGDGTSAEVAYLRKCGIGDVAETATTVASQHPAHAETIRIHDERLNGPEDHL